MGMSDFEFSQAIDRSATDKLLYAMKRSLSKMEGWLGNGDELKEFFKLYTRYLKTRCNKIVWENIESPKEKIIDYSQLSNTISDDSHKLLEKLVVLKLNGGLGTTMGCVGPKSAIVVREGKNFLDLVFKQLKFINKEYNVDVPLLLMNSFNTDTMTQKLVSRYDNIKMFNQSVYPRICAETLLPINGSTDTKNLYPPGHGDLFHSLKNSGMLDELINEGKEYLFVSNIDNLAATVDLKLLKYFADENLEFMMEVTNKTRADVKGGTLIDYDGYLRLLEIAQVPANKKSEFTSVRKFKIFNTNSVWINLKSLKEKLENDTFDLDIIENKKMVDDMQVIQLETAIGSAIRFFERSCGIVVPRSRFLPVKTCSDLFLIESNCFVELNGTLRLNPKRVPQTVPTIKLLGKNFNKIEEFDECFKGIPDILELDSLTVTGDVKFGKNVMLKGNVTILADEKSSIYIPDGAVLDDNIVFGNLHVIDQ